MPCLADLDSYRPAKDDPPGRLIRFLKSCGWAMRDAEDLISFRGRYMPLHAADFLWLLALDGARFDSPEARAEMEQSLMEKISTIRNETMRNQYRLYIRERLRSFFGFDYRHRQSAKSNVVSLSSKRALLGSLENLERLNKASLAMRDDGCFEHINHIGEDKEIGGKDDH